MTDAGSVFRRLGSMGWLALAGTPPLIGQSEAQISERLLEVSDLSRQPMILMPDDIIDAPVQAFVEDLEILLDVELQIVNPDELADEALQELWLNAGIMILAGGSSQYWQDLIGERLFRMRPQEILAEGAVLFAFGACAGAMGAWMLDEFKVAVDKGLGWLLGGVVVPGNTDPAEIAAIYNLLEEQEGVYALGLPDEAMLALGPQDQIEVWTERAPVLLLGKGWQR